MRLTMGEEWSSPGFALSLKGFFISASPLSVLPLYLKKMWEMYTKFTASPPCTITDLRSNISDFLTHFYYSLTSTISRLLLHNPQSNNCYCNLHDNLFHSLQSYKTLAATNCHYPLGQHGFFHQVHNHCYN